VDVRRSVASVVLPAAPSAGLSGEQIAMVASEQLKRIERSDRPLGNRADASKTPLTVRPVSTVVRAHRGHCHRVRLTHRPVGSGISNPEANIRSDSPAIILGSIAGHVTGSRPKPAS
jgi:hypothetical protein